MLRELLNGLRNRMLGELRDFGHRLDRLESDLHELERVVRELKQELARREPGQAPDFVGAAQSQAPAEQAAPAAQEPAAQSQAPAEQAAPAAQEPAAQEAPAQEPEQAESPAYWGPIDNESARAKAAGKVLTIDADECIGCGTCVEYAESVFAMDDNARAIVISQEGPMDQIQEAIDACPVACISWK